MKKGGLQRLPEDKRDLQLGAFFMLPKLEELPDSFTFEPTLIGDQGEALEDDFCSAYASCGASSLQENTPLYPAFSFALSKKLSGNVDDWGQDLRSAMKAHQKFGAVPTNIVDDGIAGMSMTDKRVMGNYPLTYLAIASIHKKKSYWKVRGQYDAYDDIRATIWKFREQQRAPVIGLTWSWPLEQYKLDTISGGFGHALYVIGWTPDGLIIVNSYGRNAGSNGTHLITREVINEYIPRYGAYVFVDMTPEDAIYAVEANIKEGENWIVQLFKRLIMIFT